VTFNWHAHCTFTLGDFKGDLKRWLENVREEFSPGGIPAILGYAEKSDALYGVSNFTGFISRNHIGKGSRQMQYTLTHLVFIISVSMAILLLVLAVLAVLVSWLLKVMPECETVREGETGRSQPPAESQEAEELDRLAAVIAVALARGQSMREQTFKESKIH